MKEYVFEARLQLQVLAESEEEARRRLSMRAILHDGDFELVDVRDA